MRKEFWMLLIVNGSIILFLIYQVFDLITLLNDDSAPYTLTQDELAPVEYTEVVKTAPNGTQIVTLEPDRPLLIPKIIHQTYKTDQIPEKWKETHQTVLDLHPNYEYILWTDEMARNFIKEHFEWFLPTFDSYPYNIMRADVIRYFVLSVHGGVYIDLDNGCTHNMDPLLAMPAWLRKTDPTGVSNDLMGSRPQHPYFLKVIDNLERYNRNWFISYITIMYSTGPLFLSVLWKQYKRWGVAEGAEVRLLLPVNGSNHASYFFYQGEGSSWHQDDAKLIFQMGRHWFLLTIVITAIVFGFFYLQYKLYQRLSFNSLVKFRRWFQRALRSSSPRSTKGSRVYVHSRSRSSSPLVASTTSGQQSPSSAHSWSRSASPVVFGKDDFMLSEWDDKEAASIHIDRDDSSTDEYPYESNTAANLEAAKLMARPRSRNDGMV